MSVLSTTAFRRIGIIMQSNDRSADDADAYNAAVLGVPGYRNSCLKPPATSCLRPPILQPSLLNQLLIVCFSSQKQQQQQQQQQQGSSNSSCLPPNQSSHSSSRRAARRLGLCTGMCKQKTRMNPARTPIPLYQQLPTYLIRDRLTFTSIRHADVR